MDPGFIPKYRLPAGPWMQHDAPSARHLLQIETENVCVRGTDG